MFKEFAKGLSITLKHLLPGNTTTVQYPKEKLEMAPRFRGSIVWFPLSTAKNVLPAIFVRQYARLSVLLLSLQRMKRVKSTLRYMKSTCCVVSSAATVLRHVQLKLSK